MLGWTLIKNEFVFSFAINPRDIYKNRFQNLLIFIYELSTNHTIYNLSYKIYVFNIIDIVYILY